MIAAVSPVDSPVNLVAHEVGPAIAAGGVPIQVPTFRADQQPYGGIRDIGNTREGPADAGQEMTEMRFVMVDR